MCRLSTTGGPAKKFKSVDSRIFERMCDRGLAEYFKPSDTDQSRGLIERMCTAGRAEAQAAADRLDAIWELFELRRKERGEMVDWAVDTWAAVGAEVAAALRTSLGMAGSYMRYARAMWERLPAIAAAFRAGDIDYRMFQTLVYRTDMIKDPAILARVDAELAVAMLRWPPGPSGWAANARRRSAVRVRLGSSRWSFMWWPSSPRCRVAGERPWWAVTA